MTIDCTVYDPFGIGYAEICERDVSTLPEPRRVPAGVIELLAFFRRCDNEAVDHELDMEYESTLNCGGCELCGRL